MKLNVTVSAKLAGNEFSGSIEIGSHEYMCEQILEAAREENPENEDLENFDEDFEFEITDWEDLEEYGYLQDIDLLEDLADYSGNYDLDIINAGVGANIDISDIDEAYQGEFSSDADFAENICTETGDIPRDFPSYIYIDWERTARDIMYDYVELNGYYFRTL